MFLTKEQTDDQKLIRYLMEQVIEEPVSTIDRISSGWVSHTYEVNGHLICKFPSQMTAIEDWQNYTLNAPALQRHLSYQIPQTRLKPVFLSATSDEALISSCHEKIVGDCLPSSRYFSELDLGFKKQFFEQLSNAALEIHSTPIGCLPVRPPHAEETLKRFFAKPVRHLYLEKIFDKLIHAPYIGCRRASEDILCHCDLHPANVCLDRSGKITGILDFDSLSCGEPFVEFRPGLYFDGRDKNLFQEIYSNVSGSKINSTDIVKMYATYGALYAFRSFSANPKVLCRKIKNSLRLFQRKQRD